MHKNMGLTTTGPSVRAMFFLVIAKSPLCRLKYSQHNKLTVDDGYMSVRHNTIASSRSSCFYGSGTTMTNNRFASTLKTTISCAIELGNYVVFPGSPKHCLLILCGYIILRSLPYGLLRIINCGGGHLEPTNVNS